MILIDIEMPEKCGLCPCFHAEFPMYCQLIKPPYKDKRIVAPYGLPRPEWCPLKEQEAKTGTWQWKIHGKAESGGTLGEAICDQCGKSTYATAVKGDLNYCQNCGAKMTDRR